MIINTPELTLLFRYIRVQVVSVLGGEPKHWHSDEELDEYLTNIDERMVCLLHDLLVMLDYVYTLKLNNIDLENEERDRHPRRSSRANFSSQISKSTR